MVIRKLEKKDEPTLEDVIEKGGSVPSEKSEGKKDWVNFTLRIRRDILEEIAKAIEERVGITKTVWILEAIQEKLKRKP